MQQQWAGSSQSKTGNILGQGIDFIEKMADRTGLEPATSGVTGRHSNQLNYRSAMLTTYSLRLI